MALTKTEETELKEFVAERLYEKAKKEIIEKYTPQIKAIQDASNKIMTDRVKDMKAIIDKQNAEIAALENE